MEAVSATTPHLGHLRDASELTQPATPLLRLTDIAKRWRGLDHPVLDGLDLEIGEGEAIHISGRNGVGKTTLLRIVTGLIVPDRGEISLSGLDPESDRRAYQKQIAFLAAGDRGLYARLPVRSHLDLWTRVGFVPRARRRQLIDRAIERFELTSLADRRVDRLSMGQRQRVRLAGLLLHEPRLVMLDEPTNSLDDEGIALAASAFNAVLDAGGGVIWCSPAGELAKLDFARSYVLRDGTLDPR